jgi:hypothetical protein
MAAAGGKGSGTFSAPEDDSLMPKKVPDPPTAPSQGTFRLSKIRLRRFSEVISSASAS